MVFPVWKELKNTFRLATPITIGLIGQSLFAVIDTVMIGKMLGEHALASATLANNVNLVPLLFAMGVCLAIPVLTAQAHGAMRANDVPKILRHGLLVVIGSSAIGAALVCVFALSGGLSLLGQPENVASDAVIFSCIIALSIPAAAGFQAVKSFRDATGGQWISLTWIGIGLCANVFLNYAMMSGSFFFPNLGMEGAAAGTLLSRLISFLGITFHRQLVCEFRKGFSLAGVRENLRIAVPSALHMLFEGGLFIVSPFFMGWISEAAIAANQIVMAVTTVIYMIPFGISQALSIRVGEAFGEKNFQKIRSIFWGATAFTLALLGTNAVVLICLRNRIPVEFNVSSEAVSIAADIFIVAGMYMLFDAYQTISSGMLRGLGDVKIIASAAFVSYWIIGCPTALVLAFPCGLGGVGVWIGLATGLASAAIIFGFRVYKDLRQHRAGTQESPALS